MVFLDIEMPGMKGLDVLREIRTREKDFPVVMITAYGSIDLAVEAMKEAPMILFQSLLSPAISRLWSKRLWKARLRREKEVLSEEVDKRYRLVAGNSAKFNAAISSAKNCREQEHDFTIGGDGTDEAFARAIHNWSERKDRPFIAIASVFQRNCGGELFGYEKGAFTGASQLKRGRSKSATVERSFSTKSAISPRSFRLLLRFLQEREFERVGGTQLIRVDVRIIAATNRNLTSKPRSKRFRRFILPYQCRSHRAPSLKRAERRRAGSGPVFHATIF